jgi:hypothetical protein
MCVFIPHQVSPDDSDVEYHPQIMVCVSDNASYFQMALYVIQGALLAFGAFLAFETRKVIGYNNSVLIYFYVLRFFSMYII